MEYLEFLRTLARARAAYSTGGIAGASSEIKQVFDAYDALRARGYLNVENALPPWPYTSGV